MAAALILAILLGAVLLGVFVGWLIKPMKAKAITGGLLIAAPFVVTIPVFAMADSAECDGGDCGGAMMLMGFLALFLVPAAILGVGILIQAVFSKIAR